MLILVLYAVGINRGLHGQSVIISDLWFVQHARISEYILLSKKIKQMQSNDTRIFVCFVGRNLWWVHGCNGKGEQQLIWSMQPFSGRTCDADMNVCFCPTNSTALAHIWSFSSHLSLWRFYSRQPWRARKGCVQLRSQAKLATTLLSTPTKSTGKLQPRARPAKPIWKWRLQMMLKRL